MSELIGKSFDGEDMRIPLSDVVKILNDAGVEIDPATIQLADDPRKQMLDEIREKVVGIKSKSIAYGLVLKILDEMEDKL